MTTQAKWQPAHNDPRGRWGAYEFSILCLDSGVITGGPEVNVVYREVGVSVWLSCGHGDGNVYTAGIGASTGWEGDVGAAGGFASWWTAILTDINARIGQMCRNLGPETPLAFECSGGESPATFSAFREWLYNDGVWTGGAVTPQPGPQPTPAGTIIWGARWFENGLAFESGSRYGDDGLPVARVCRYMRPNVGWVMLPQE